MRTFIKKRIAFIVLYIIGVYFLVLQPFLFICAFVFNSRHMLDWYDKIKPEKLFGVEYPFIYYRCYYPYVFGVFIILSIVLMILSNNGKAKIHKGIVLIIMVVFGFIQLLIQGLFTPIIS